MAMIREKNIENNSHLVVKTKLTNTRWRRTKGFS